MQIYEVGGAVRDSMLGEPVAEHDWVVVGATKAAMLELGFKQVGKDFPVFLHPRTGEEYALARMERKVAPGHAGFEFDFSSETTLLEDLKRRDLTVNAIARDSNGKLIDPYGGIRDLHARVLRHVSDAFREDPLRVLRVARFAAQLHHYDFSVAGETLTLMREITDSGELETLSADRVWLETEKALGTRRPDIYFFVMRDCGALGQLFPEVEALFGVPQPVRWHPEIDAGLHTMMALRLAARLTASVTVRFAVLTHDLGKATTPKHLLPSHHGHSERSVQILGELCARLPVPNRMRKLAEHVARQHGIVHRAERLSAQSIFELILDVDGLRRPDSFEELLIACEADARGRLGLEDRAYPQADRLRRALKAAIGARGSAVRDNPSLTGPALGQAIHESQLAAIDSCLNT